MESASTPTFAHECKIRDYYCSRLKEFRRDELAIKREATFEGWALRADLRTVDHNNVLREWEFKIRADYSSLGQILTYTALMREQLNFERDVQGVIAAFQIPDYLLKAIRINNLSIELVTLPEWMAKAGEVPLTTQELSPIEVPHIPRLSDVTKPAC